MKVTLCDPWTIQSMEFSRPEHWSGYPFPYPGNLPNPGHPHRVQILYQLSHKGRRRILEWVAYLFSSRFPELGIKPGSPASQADSLPTELSGKPSKYPLNMRYLANLSGSWARLNILCRCRYQRLDILVYPFSCLPCYLWAALRIPL